MANPIPPQPQPKYHPYFAWDAPTRWFHWINALGVIGLIATGLVILNGEGLGLSVEGKIALKSVHVWFGYVMAVNLLWRFVWAFFGNRYARWRAVLPVGAGFMTALQAYVASFLSGEPQQYVGHNPLARIGVSSTVSLAACSDCDRPRARWDRPVLAPLRTRTRRMDSCYGCRPRDHSARGL